MCQGIISRAEAKAQGLKRYFTGRPCKHGHIANRSTIDGRCHECARLQARIRFEEHPEAVRACQRRYNRKNTEKRKASKRKWIKSHPEKRKLQRERYKKKHPLNVLASNKKYYYKNREALIAARTARYNLGPSNPQSPIQWLRKAQALNRSLSRLAKSSNPDLSLLPKLDLPQ